MPDKNKHITPRRLVIGMTGASGAPLTLALLRRLRAQTGLELHFIASQGAKLTAEYEMPGRWHDYLTLVDATYSNGQIDASIASGSFQTEGMIIVPCSMKTVAGIHSGYADNLLLRAADVTLKERRPLLLVPRETPLSPIHLRNLYELSMMGVSIVPPMMTFYNRASSIEDMEAHLVGKIMDLLGIPAEYQRWQ